MADHTQIKSLSRFQQMLKDHFLNGAEVAGEKQAYNLTVPNAKVAKGNPKAGLSVGWVQRDLSKTDPAERQSVLNVLTRDPVLGKDENRGTLDKIIGKKASQLTKADRDFLAEHEKAINNALSSAEGQAVLNGLSAVQTGILEQKVNQLAAKAGPLAKDFMDSTEGKLRIADYLNQFGTNTDRLEPFLQGTEVTLNNGRNSIKLDQPMTVEKWRDYVGSTKHGTEHKGDVDRRFREIDKSLERQNIKPEAPRRETTPVPKASDGARAPGQPGDGAPAAEQQRAAARIGEKGEARDLLLRPEDRGPGGNRNLLLRPGDASKDAPREKTTPEIRNFLDFATRPPKGADAILLKRPEQVTEDEMLSLIRRPEYEHDRTLGDAVRKWHLAFYGDGPIPRDVTGRQIDSPPIRPVPERPAAPVAADGGDLVDGTRRMAETVMRAHRPELPEGIKRLQQALNGPSMQRPAGGTSLRTDGEFGPATRRRLQQEIAGIGVRKLQDAFLKMR